MTDQSFKAGAAVAEITPDHPMPLAGYPHVERISAGVHDPLLASALCVSDGEQTVLLISCDLLFVPRQVIKNAQQEISRQTEMSGTDIIIAATHTHSGPVTHKNLCREEDPLAAEPDENYHRFLEQRIIEAGLTAWRNLKPAEADLAIANGKSVGTHRHEPTGPSDPDVPVLVLRQPNDQQIIAVMVVCCMHPTVLHEDSLLISGDFPAMARQYVQQNHAGPDTPVIYFIGPAGNQSPRHVTNANTFEEAERLGRELGAQIVSAIQRCDAFRSDHSVKRHIRELELPPRDILPAGQAEEAEEQARKRLEDLQRSDAPRTKVRTAECDLFGAEQTATLARAVEAGRFGKAIDQTMPAEAGVVCIGPWRFVTWPGEVFVEFGLAARQGRSDTFVITLANGDLQGYLVTREAVEQGWYEAGNAIFKSPESGEMLLAATTDLLDRLTPSEDR